MIDCLASFAVDYEKRKKDREIFGPDREKLFARMVLALYKQVTNSGDSLGIADQHSAAKYKIDKLLEKLPTSDEIKFKLENEKIKDTMLNMFTGILSTIGNNPKFNANLIDSNSVASKSNYNVFTPKPIVDDKFLIKEI